MENDERTELEAEATRRVIAFIENDQADTPASIAAGALLRAGVAIALEAFGPGYGPQASREALERILADQEHTRSLQ